MTEKNRLASTTEYIPHLNTFNITHKRPKCKTREIAELITGSIWSEGIGNNTMCACLACALIINCSDLKKYEALRERENQEV